MRSVRRASGLVQTPQGCANVDGSFSAEREDRVDPRRAADRNNRKDDLEGTDVICLSSPGGMSHSKALPRLILRDGTTGAT